MFIVGTVLALVGGVYLIFDAAIDGNQGYGVAGAGYFIAAVLCFK